MTNMTKFAIAVGVTVVGVGVTAYYGKKMYDKKVKADEESNPVVETETEDEGLIAKIKKATVKKAIKILAWVALHQRQIEAVTTILSLGGAVFSIVNAVRDYRAGNKMREQIDFLVEDRKMFKSAWDLTMDNYNTNWETVIHEQHDEVMNKLDDIHLDMGMIHEIHESLVTPPKKLKRA